MKKIPATLAMTALALAIPAALAQQFSGSVSVTGIWNDVNGDNPFRFFEYRDLDDGVTGGFDVNTAYGDWWHNLFGENLGRDTQLVRLRGGRYGIFKYSVYADDVIHNLTYNAITPFTGVGTANLDFTPPGTDLSTWTRFQYGLQHRNVGGFAEAQPGVDSPLYFRVTANRKRTDGLRPLGQPGTSPGGPVYELPLVMDWTTTDVSGEAGYATKSAHFSVNVLYSKFEEANDFLNWRVPIVTTGTFTDRSYLATDNELWRVGVNGMVKNLPMNSSLALRGTYTKTEGSRDVPTTWLSISGTTGNVRLANPSETHWDGEIVNKSFSAALNSEWARGINSKLYYNYYERDNNSHHIVFTPGGPGSGGGCDVNLVTGAIGPTCTTEFLHFKKNNLGVDVQFRVNRDNKVTVGLDYLDTERERVDYDRSKEKKLTLEWKSGVLGWADTRVKYQRMERDSDFRLAESQNVFLREVHRFDAAPLDRDLFKVSFDATPVPLLDLGAEFIVKKNDYHETFLGRNRDRREEVYLSASYGDPQALRVTAFADYERTKYDSTHWVGATTTFPERNQAGTAYLWEGFVRDKNYLFGIAADMLVSPRLKLHGSFIWQDTDGTVDFASQDNLGNPVPVDAYDSFRKKTLHVKGTYGATRDLDLTLGAAWEKFDYSDVQLDGYIHNLRTGTTQNFFSGAWAFQSYKATVVYLTATYRF